MPSVTDILEHQASDRDIRIGRPEAHDAVEPERANNMICYISTSGTGDAWVANELGQMHRAGVPFVLFAMRKPQHTYHLSEWAASIYRDTQSIYPLPLMDFVCSMLFAPFLFRGQYFGALWNAFTGERESLRARVAGLAHFLVASHLARTVRRLPVNHIHSQWVHSCGTIAMYTAWLLGKSYSFTGHAADLFRERCALRDKIRRAEFIVCISSFHRDFFLREGARPEQLMTVYCGIDVRQFEPRSARREDDGVIRIRSSGRLVEKKGFSHLIDACRILADRGIVFECRIGGSGPLEGSLNSKIKTLGLEDRIIVTGEALKQENIPAFMHGGDVYCLPCVWASDNDVDGLPQMLMEAMACGLPVVSTRLVGIPDLVMHEKTGLLIESKDNVALADAIERLGRDHALATRLAQAGRNHVVEKFSITTCLEPLIAAYETRLNHRWVHS